MSDETSPAWDDELESAWQEFRGRLAEQLTLLEPHEELRIDGGPDTATPYVRLVGLERGAVRVEVMSGELVAKRRYEVAPAEPDPAMGTGLPTYDDVALDTQSALRDVLAVLHPCFLSDATPGETLEPEVCFPASREHLVDLVDRTLRPVLGDLGRDDDGDIVVVVGETVLTVRVVGDGPAVDVHAVLVRDVVDEDRARFEVNVANRAPGGPTYVVRGGEVIAQQRLPARPFAPQLLREAVRDAIESYDELAGDLISRVGGVRCLGQPSDALPDPEPAGHEARESLRTLMHLEADQPGSVDARLASHIFHHDEQAILDQITRLRRDGRVALVPLLRRALRVAVETSAAG